MVGAPALDQRDRARQRRAVAGAEFLGEGFGVGRGSLRRGHGLGLQRRRRAGEGLAGSRPPRFRRRESGGFTRPPGSGATPGARKHDDRLLQHRARAPLDTVWSLIRDFNNYPAYIDGVSESVIEDDKRGDEVGASGASAISALGAPAPRRAFRCRAFADLCRHRAVAVPGGTRRAVSPVRYEGTMSLREVTEGNRTFIEWTVALDAEPADAERWHALFQSWIPDWTDSLVRTLARGPRSWPRRRYSAASLWPSRALSLWISSSAASEITVPGGKIASAPAA